MVWAYPEMRSGELYLYVGKKVRNSGQERGQSGDGEKNQGGSERAGGRRDESMTGV